MGVINTTGPLPHGLADRVLQGGGSGGDRDNLRSQQTHPVYVQGLPPGVLPHEHHARHPHEGGSGGGGHAVLSGAGLGDEPGFSHLFRQQRLAQYVVDLMGAGVVQIFPLEVDFCTTQVAGHLFRIVEAGGTARVLVQQSGEFPVEVRIAFIEVIGFFQLNHGIHQRLRDILPTVDAEASF